MSTSQPTFDRFQVDLRGIVDLLSRHLYSSPRVFVRELAQNGIDAVAARARAEPLGSISSRPSVQFVVDASRVDCYDSGAGLTSQDVETFLSTIGGSSKRNELGLQREDQLGQFGIGLLSAFMVSDHIEVLSRPMAEGDGPHPLITRWVGSAEGTYEASQINLTDLEPDDRTAWLAQGPGTCVRLVPRHDTRTWTSPEAVIGLAREYLHYLDHPIVVRTDDALTAISPTPQPWADREGRLRAAQDLRLEPFATIALTVPEAGLDGVAVISAEPIPPGRADGDHVYLRGMLLGHDVRELSPGWIVFARCVVNATGLRPTASRESLYDDDLTEHVRDSIGAQVKRWLARLAESDPRSLARFLSAHHLALKAHARHDPELADLLVPLLPFDTNRGRTTLSDLGALADEGPLSFLATVDEYRQVLAVARAQGLWVINAGYAYDADLLREWARRHPDRNLREITPADLSVHLDAVDAGIELGARPVLVEAEDALAAPDVAVLLRSFEPSSLPALLLDDRDSWRTRDQVAVAQDADDALAALLSSVATTTADGRPRLVLNHRHTVVRRILTLRDPATIRLAAQSLYVRALHAGNHPVRPADTAVVEESFGGLLNTLLDTHATNDLDGDI